MNPADFSEHVLVGHPLPSLFFAGSSRRRLLIAIRFPVKYNERW